VCSSDIENIGVNDVPEPRVLEVQIIFTFFKTVRSRAISIVSLQKMGLHFVIYT